MEAVDVVLKQGQLEKRNNKSFLGIEVFNQAAFLEHAVMIFLSLKFFTLTKVWSYRWLALKISGFDYYSGQGGRHHKFIPAADIIDVTNNNKKRRWGFTVCMLS